MKGIVFIKDNKIMNPTSNQIATADRIAVRFETQKNGDRNCVRHAAKTQHRTLCPVKAAAKIIQRLRKINASPDDFIYLYRDREGVNRQLTAQMTLQALREFVKFT